MSTKENGIGSQYPQKEGGVSVVLITRNRSRFVVDAISSILEKTDDNTPFELIVIDNGSTDDTETAILSQFPSVKLITLDENLGVSGGRDLGVREARYEIVMFMDDDAILSTKGALHQLSSFLTQNQDVAVVALRIVNDHSGLVLQHEFPKRGRLKGYDLRSVQEVTYFVGCGFALKKSVYQSISGFCRQMMYGPEEVDLSYRVLQAGYRIVYLPDVEVRHRTNPDMRRHNEWFRNEMQSRIILAVRNLPIWAAIPYLTFWLSKLFFMAAISGNTVWYMRGVSDGWSGLSVAFEQRNPISINTARYIWKNGGRVFY